MNDKPSYDYGNSTSQEFASLKSITFVYGTVKKVNLDVDLDDEIEPGTMEVAYLRGGDPRRREVPINFGSFGIYGGIRVMPKPGDTVILGLNPDGTIYHLGAIGFKYRDLVEKHLNTETTLADSLQMQHLRPGEVHLQAAEGDKLSARPTPRGQIYLDNKGNVDVKDGNLQVMRLDTETRELYVEDETIRSKNHRVRFSQGVVKREQIQTDLTKKLVPRTYFGIPVVTSDTPMLSEWRLKVGQDVDVTGDDSGDPVLEITIADEVLDDSSVNVYDDSIKKVNVLIKHESGVDITINSDGKININNGSMVIVPKKRSARENDEIENPIGVTFVDTSHPSQAARALTNVAEITALATMFLSPTGPCIFVPSANVNLKGLITAGSNTLYVGD